MTTLFEATFDDTSKWHHHCMRQSVGQNDYELLEIGNVFVPSEFDYMFFRHGKPVAHNPANAVGWSQPEGHHESIDQFAYRVYEGYAAWMCFGFYRIIDCGLAKSITIPSRGTLTITMAAHGWSSTDDDPNTSNDVIGAYSVPEGTPGLTDGQRNHTFWVGVGDPLFPASMSVGKHIYNTYDTLTHTISVEPGPLTVFARGKALWEFKHNNFYFDSFKVTFEPEDEQPPHEECEGTPREQYERTYLLLPPGAGNEWIQAVVDSGIWEARRITIGGSADDAGIGALDYREVLAVNPSLWSDSLELFFAQYYPGTKYTPALVDTPEALKEWLIEWMSATNPTPPPTGGSQLRSPGLHLNTGDSGASDQYNRLHQELAPDQIPPSIKAYGTPSTMATLKLFKDIDPRILTVGRLSCGLNGEDVEGVDLSGDLLEAAQHTMTISMAAWSAHRNYVDVWEIINEQDPVGTAGHSRMAIFFMHCMDIANANGYTIALFSYSLGVPEWDEIQAIVATGCLAQALRDGHYISLHEYTDPLDNAYGEPIDGTEPNPNRGPFACRYRYWQDAVGGPELMPNVLLTEVNVARDLRTISPADWDRQIRWYMTEVSKDAYVKAVHLFGWGSLGDAWSNFDIQLAGLANTWYQIVLDYSQNDLTPPQYDIVPYSQRDWRWSQDRLLPSAYIVGSAGCAMVSACMYATQVNPMLTPKILNDWLGQNDGYTDNGLLVWSKVADYVDGLSFVNYFTFDPDAADHMNQVYSLLETGPCIIQVDFYPGGEINSHFVLALYAQNNDIRMIDPWTGEEGWLLEVYGEQNDTLGNSIFRLAQYAIEEPTPSTQTLVGINDHPGTNGTGAQWMMAENIKGLIVRPIFMSGCGSALDFSKEEAAGLRVIVNLRYSWSTDMGGGGTIPAPNTPEWTQFVNAAAQTINTSCGVWGWEIANEINNPREWPNATLTPTNMATTYNAIRRLVNPDKRNMSPGALDPFNAAAGDPREWLSQIYTQIDGCEFVTAHGYIRGPDPLLVNSTDMFADAPLQWQYLNYYRCITALLEVLPSQFNDRPRYVTECNHLTIDGVEPHWGWVNDSRASQVVDAVMQIARQLEIAGVAFYRWYGDEWHINDNPFVLEAIKQNASS